MIRRYFNLEEIKEFMQKYKARFPHNKIATTNGCFDVLHYGHLQGFERAKNSADVLIVGINSDDYIRKFKLREPVHNELQRAYNLAQLRSVDGVVLFTQDDPTEFLKAVKPHYHFKSSSGYKGIEEPILKQLGGNLVLTEDIPGFSSSRVINDKEVFRMCFEDESE